MTAGATTICDPGVPNPWTSRVGEGNTAAGDDRLIEVQGGSEISAGNDNAISLRDRASITVRDGGVVRNQATTANGQFGTGGNVIEFRDNGTLTIEQGGRVLAEGTQGSAEAVNFQGTGNTIINSGIIDADNAVAIWSQNTSGLNTVINTETGVIEAGNGLTSTVIGGSGNGALDFTNRGTVRGSIRLAGGNDILRLFTGSIVTGGFSGGGGFDQIFLSGTGTASLPGDFDGFESLIKNDTGTWTLSGTITGVTVADVQNGTLILTGNNTKYTGQVLVQPTGAVQARAQSLPPTVTNDGLVRFAQPDDGSYVGLISGAGVVEKTGAGVLTLAPGAPGGNTYSGGTRIKEGVVAIGADSALGVSTGSLTFDGGTLRFDRAFDLSPGRAIAIDAGGGTFDTQGFTTTISQGTTGTGALSKIGAGSLILTGNNGHSGGTTVNEGTLAVGGPASAGAALSGGGLVSVAAGATLGGYGGIVGDVVNRGQIAVADAIKAFASGPKGNFTIAGTLTNAGVAQIAGAGIGNRLTVTSYVGQSGQVSLNTYLGTDASPSDKLVVSGGSASGSSALHINNVGGPGGQTFGSGILVVESINGGTSTASAFSLAGPVAAGAYEYLLFRGGVEAGTGNNWYLRNTVTAGTPISPSTPAPGSPPLPPSPAAGEADIPLYRAEVPIYAAVPAMARQLGMATLGTFHQRQGEQALLAGQGGVPAGWGRVFGQRTEQRWSGAVKPEFDGQLKGLQTGLDLYAIERVDGHRDRFGLFFGYARSDGDVRGFAVGLPRSPVGKLDLNAYSVGAYWTHIGPSDWYVDAVLMESRIEGEGRSERGVGAKTDGTAVTASLEGGYPVSLGAGWTIEPQAQLIWQHLSLATLRDRFAVMSYEGGHSFTGRLGARLQGSFLIGSTQLQPYLNVNIWHNFDKTDKIVFNATDVIPTKFGGSSLEVGGGVVAKLSSAVSLFATGGYTTELAGRERRTMQGNLGVRVSW